MDSWILCSLSQSSQIIATFPWLIDTHMWLLVRAELLGPWDKSFQPTADLILLMDTPAVVLCTDGAFTLKEIIHIDIRLELETVKRKIILVGAKRC